MEQKSQVIVIANYRHQISSCTARESIMRLIEVKIKRNVLMLVKITHTKNK